MAALLFHGEEDVNVSLDQSRKMNEALKCAETPVEYVECDEPGHQVGRNAYCVDMPERIGAFLDRRTGGTRRPGPRTRGPHARGTGDRSEE